MLVSIGFHSLYLPKNSLWMLQKDMVFLTNFFLVYCPSGSYWKASINWCWQFDLVTIKLNLTCWCQWGSIHYVCQKILGGIAKRQGIFDRIFSCLFYCPSGSYFWPPTNAVKEGTYQSHQKKCFCYVFVLLTL